MRKALLEFLVVGLGGSLGAMARFGVARLFAWSAFPMGTMVVNLTGCLFLGWFMTVIGDRIVVSESTRLAVAVGFVGAFTTFSTYMYESNKMLEDGAGLRAAFYLLGSLILGLIAVRLGIALGRSL